MCVCVCGKRGGGGALLYIKAKGPGSLGGGEKPVPGNISFYFAAGGTTLSTWVISLPGQGEITLNPIKSRRFCYFCPSMQSKSYSSARPSPGLTRGVIASLAQSAPYVTLCMLIMDMKGGHNSNLIKRYFRPDVRSIASNGP